MKGKNTTVRRSADEAMQQHIDSARKSYSRAKDGIIQAIAYAYLVYRTVETNSNAAALIDNQIATRNSTIANHNKHQHDERSRAQKLARALSDKDLNSDESARLKALAALSEEVWKAKHIKLKIEDRTEANACSRIVKHIFNLDSRADAPNASRYTTAVLWVSDNCRAVKSAADIVTAVKNAGGLDKIIELQRLANSTSPDVGHDVPTPPRAAITKQPPSKSHKSRNRDALNKAKTLAFFKMTLDAAQPDDFVLLVGRYRKSGKVEIVRAAPLADDKLDAAVDLLDAAAESVPPSKPTARLAAQRRMNRQNVPPRSML